MKQLFIAILLLSSLASAAQRGAKQKEKPTQDTAVKYVPSFFVTDTVAAAFIYVDTTNGNILIYEEGFIVMKGFKTQSSQWITKPEAVAILSRRKEKVSGKLLSVVTPM